MQWNTEKTMVANPNRTSCQYKRCCSRSWRCIKRGWDPRGVEEGSAATRGQRKVNIRGRSNWSTTPRMQKKPRNSASNRLGESQLRRSSISFPLDYGRPQHEQTDEAAQLQWLPGLVASEGVPAAAAALAATIRGVRGICRKNISITHRYRWIR